MNARQPKFAVGDRVKVSREERFGKYQRRGEVKRVYQDSSNRSWWYLIEFDDSPSHTLVEGFLELEPLLETLARCGAA
jgi:hypothetical protein